MTHTLELKDVHVSVDGKDVVKGVSLTISSGKITALMGPNGSGKSSLAHALMGHPRYQITKGKILFDEKDITKLAVHERARLGLFLSFQYPLEINGVTVTNFLRSAYQAVSGKDISVVDFYTLLKEKMKLLGIDSAFSKRYVNEGFSGGEKKKMEMLQMSVLQPKIALLDEVDSGTDVDALKVIAQSITRMKSPSFGALVITHYQRLLEYVVPDQIYVMVDGRIVHSGGKELALDIEKKGYDFLREVSA
jgi:Fe-S cluster assembly ATP-binding protein